MNSRAHNDIFIFRQRFLKVPTMSNLASSYPTGGTHPILMESSPLTVRVSSDDLPQSISLQENPHSLKRHVSWSDTPTSKVNVNYQVFIPNLPNTEPPDIKIELDNHPYKDRRKVV